MALIHPQSTFPRLAWQTRGLNVGGHVHPWFCRAHGGGAAAFPQFHPSCGDCSWGTHATWDQSPGGRTALWCGTRLQPLCDLGWLCGKHQRGDIHLLDPYLALYESKWNNGLDRALLRWMWKLYLKTSYMKYGKREMIKRLKRTGVVYSREKEAEGRYDNSERVNS